MAEQDTSNTGMLLERDPKKRKLVESDGLEISPPVLPPFKRHENLWFEDGNIILIAGGIGFKVSITYGQYSLFR